LNSLSVRLAEPESLQTLEVYQLEANLGFYTAPGTKPAYITVEAAQFGVIPAVADPTLETGETRATAVATGKPFLVQTRRGSSIPHRPLNNYPVVCYRR
jgi:hypothetical protein